MTRNNRLTSDDILLLRDIMVAGSFAAAAEPLGLTPSAVSRAVSRIGSALRVICASPAYLDRFGTPTQPSDLERHSCLGILGHEGLARWAFDTGNVTVTPRLRADSAVMLRAMAIHGAGLVRLADFVVADALRDGMLRAVLTDLHRSKPLRIHALTLPGPKPPPRIRAFVGFLAELLRAPPQGGADAG